jgi:Spy/CpxP family protein refolding chaperone
MRGASMLLLMGFGMICAAAAENDLPVAAIDDKAKLLGQRKALYVMRQIDLTEAQAGQMKALIDSIPSEEAPVELNVDRVRQLYQEIEKAKKAGDNAKVDELTKEMERMGKEAAHDEGTFDHLKALLTDEQKAAVDETLEELARNPSGGVRPVDLVRIAKVLNLTDEQKFGLRQAQEKMRKALYPNLRPNLEKRLEIINLLHVEIRKILTPEQLAAYEARVRRLRPDLIDEGLLVKKP